MRQAQGSRPAHQSLRHCMGFAMCCWDAVMRRPGLLGAANGLGYFLVTNCASPTPLGLTSLRGSAAPTPRGGKAGVRSFGAFRTKETILRDSRALWRS